MAGIAAKDLSTLIRPLKDDLRERSEFAEFATPLQAEYEAAREAKRVDSTYESWREGQLEQIAVAWILSTVFIRFSEDNGLVADAWLSGPGTRLDEAHDRQAAYFRSNPHHNYADWLLAAVEHMSANVVAKGLFDKRHNPMWRVTLSTDGSKLLLDKWRQRTGDGEVAYDLTDEKWDTRFLGDLYQDLSDYAKKTYALLQTPEFVEEFILDYTLTPALKTFGLSEKFRMIDPACGSGHFLLGGFRRLLEAWRAQAPDVDDWMLIRRALASVHGVDKNPFAAAVARFRLLVAAMREGKVATLREAGDWKIQIAVADSLFHGGLSRPGMVTGAISPAELQAKKPFTFHFEDIDEYRGVLQSESYHCVVGNPPYITVKDKAENETYRQAFGDVCKGTYSLSVPFAALLFELAVEGGYVGQITANSFMKREFGKKLIEEYFAKRVELTHIVDTSGAYIPGHGTPTVILFGRNRAPQVDGAIRAVLGARGEPGAPAVPSDGIVWKALTEQIKGTGSSHSESVTVETATRHRFAYHPWSVSGGGAGDLLEIISRAKHKLAHYVTAIGRTTVVGEDDAWAVPNTQAATRAQANTKELVIGEAVRDFAVSSAVIIWNPYVNSEQTKVIAGDSPLPQRVLWPMRALLERRVIFGRTMADQGRAWFEHLENYTDKLRAPLSIAFAEVATHNHFVLDRGGKVFKQTAPVIKLPDGATEDEHLALLAVLNSSVACYWMKQVSHEKGGSGVGRGVQDERWEARFAFNATRLQELPLRSAPPLEFGRVLDSLAQELADRQPSVICATATPSRDALAVAKREAVEVWHSMISAQEELDWRVYADYGLLSASEREALPADPAAVPPLALGERAFEIVLARRVAAGEAETQWFERHGSTPITDLPSHWPTAYRELVEARISLIESRSDLALIERPECKRRWATTPWHKKEADALRVWLLDRAEAKSLWLLDNGGTAEPQLLTVNALADALRDDKDFVSVADLYATDHLGKRDADLAVVVASIVDEEHVPYLAAQRYKDPAGLRIRATWLKCWDMQREEDRTGERLNIPVPDKYTSADFRKASYWKNRGKLDVPKERFISYPGAGPDGDTSLLLGWAGWSHREQAHALAMLIIQRADTDGWAADRMTPLLAGLAEVMPWVHQWHSGYDAALGGNPAEEYQGILDEYCNQFGLTITDLEAWRPPASARGRKAAA